MYIIHFLVFLKRIRYNGIERKVPPMAGLTRKAIRQAFLLLLEQTPLDKITVKMLVDACGISRNTFYYHYEDIPALLRDILETDLAQIVRDAPAECDSNQRARLLLTYLAEHRTLFDRIYRSEHQPQLQANIQASAKDITMASIRAAGGSGLSPALQDAIALFFSSGLLSLCSQWLEDGAKEPPEVLLQRLALFDGLLETTVERAKELEQSS